MNLPAPAQDDARRAIQSRDVTDYPVYEHMEYQRDSNLPGIVEIMELDHENYPDMRLGEGDANDPDYDPDGDFDYTAARSRGNVVRKRKPIKEKRPRSRSRGRRTRSQTAIATDKQEVTVD